jgi:hypothetical protein
MDFHARSARIGENDFDTGAFQRFNENVASEHQRSDFGALFGGGFRCPRRFRGGFLVSCLAHVVSVVAGGEGNKKPTTVSSRGFLSKFWLHTTRPDGVAVYYYDDQAQVDLSDIAEHWHKD